MFDVLVVGAGPTGLMLACWLARAGVRALVIDDKDGPVNESRALGVQARTMETYDMLGLGDRACAEGVKARGAAVWAGRRKVATAVLAEMGLGVSPHPYLFIMGQDRTERMLLDDLEAHGGSVAYRTRLLSIRQDATRVTARLRLPDGTTGTVEARYAAGCDGASSAVRHALGLDFEGGTYPQRFFVADVTETGPLDEGELGLCTDESGFLAFFPMPGPHRFRVVGIVPRVLAEEEAIAFEAVRPAIERHSPMSVEAVHWFSTYRVHHRVAPHFRQGRVFLLGDAGHVHSPVGGQGMNTGLMDASNLAWKLAMVVRSGAAEHLLDTYETERMPFALSLVATTDRLFTLISHPDSRVGRVRARLFPVMFALLTHLPFARRLLFGLVSQTRVHYRASPLSRGRAGRVRAGDRLPWVQGPAGADNYAALLPRPHVQIYGEVPEPVARFLAEHPGLPLVRLPHGEAARRAGLSPGAFYLVRPDGYVAYASESFDGADFAAYAREAWGLAPEALGGPWAAPAPAMRD